MSTAILAGREPMSEANKKERLLNDYSIRLMHYQRTDDAMRRKYGMTFEEFAASEIPAENDYSWDVESDWIIWKAAVDGIATLNQRLQELNDTV